MKPISLMATMSSTLAPVLLMAGAVAFIAWDNLRDNTVPLMRAENLKELALASLNLVLIQDDASKAMMLDPDNTASGARKIKAYDANQTVLQKIQDSSPSPELNAVLKEIRDLDDKTLREIDTAVLEAMGGGKVEEAKGLYFRRYEPARAHYEALVRGMIEIADAASGETASRLEQAQGRFLRNILISLGIGIPAIVLTQFYLAGLIARRLNRIVEKSSRPFAHGATEAVASLEKTSV